MKYIPLTGDLRDRARIEALEAKTAEQDAVINSLLGLEEKNNGQIDKSQTDIPGNPDVFAESEA